MGVSGDMRGLMAGVSIGVALLGTCVLMCIFHALIEWVEPIILRRTNVVMDVMRVLDSATGGE